MAIPIVLCTNMLFNFDILISFILTDGLVFTHMLRLMWDLKGKIVEILVENGTAVEYGQPLFSVESSGEGSG